MSCFYRKCTIVLFTWLTNSSFCDLFLAVGAVMAGLPISYVATLIQWRGAFMLIEVLLAVILALTVLTRNLEYKIVGTRKKLEWDRFTHKYIFLLELKRHVYTSNFFATVIQCGVMWSNQTKIVHVNKLVATIMSLELGLRPTCASLIMIFINAQVGIGTINMSHSTSWHVSTHT